MVQRPASASDQRAIPRPRARDHSCRGGGFSLVELVVVMGIVVVLVSLLMPGLREVREATRRLQCANHIRMLGIGILAYGGDHTENLPFSRHAERKCFQDLMALTVTQPESMFDGLGLLLPWQGHGYVDNPACFFCPSHCGEHEAERNIPLLARPGATRIFGNYHYRGHVHESGMPGVRLTLSNAGDRMVFVTDGLRTRSDFNHVKGTNLLRSDGSVQWWYDSGESVIRGLPTVPGAEEPDAAFQSMFFGLLARIGREAR